MESLVKAAVISVLVLTGTALVLYWPKQTARFVLKYRIPLAVTVAVSLVVLSLVYVPWYAKPIHRSAPASVDVGWSWFAHRPEWGSVDGHTERLTSRSWEVRIDKDRANIQFWIAVVVGAGIIALAAYWKPGQTEHSLSREQT